MLMQQPIKFNFVHFSGIVIAYFVLGQIGLSFAQPPGYASPIFPPAGIAIAVAYIGGIAASFSIFLGSFLLNLFIAGFDEQPDLITLWTALLIAVASTLQALVGSKAAARLIGLQSAFDEIRPIFLFFMLVPWVCLVSAGLSNINLWLLGIIDSARLLQSCFDWWLGDIFGVWVFFPVTLALMAQPQAVWKTRRLKIILPMLLAMLVSAFFYHQSIRLEQNNQRMQFEDHVGHFLGKLKMQINYQQMALSQLRALFQVNHASGVSSVQFADYVSYSIDKLGVIQGIEWVPHVRHADRLDFEARQSETNPGFRISELDKEGQIQSAGYRDDYYPVTYIYPRVGNQKALGFDLASNPDRKKALDHALKTQVLTATSPIQFVQDNQNQAGFSLYLSTPATLLNPEGVVVTVLKIQDFIQAILNTEPLLFNVRLTDVKSSTVLFDSISDPVDASFSSMDILLGGRLLRLEVSPVAIDSYDAWGYQSYIILVTSLLGTGMLGCLLLIATGYTSRVEKQVTLKTAELVESESRFRNLANSVPVFIWMTNKYQQVNWMNQVGLDFIGDRISQFPLNFAQYIHPEDVEDYQKAFLDDFKHRKRFTALYRIRRYDGVYRWMADQGVPRWDDGLFLGYMGSCVDITEAKESAIRLQTILENATDGIHILDQNGFVKQCNRSFANMLGCSLEEAEGLNIANWEANIPLSGLIDWVNQLMLSPRSYETRFCRQDGTILDVEVSAKGIQLESQRYLYASARDITERKRMQAALYADQEKFQMLFQQSPVGMALVDYNTEQFLDVNEALLRQTGYDRQHILEYTVTQISSLKYRGLAKKFAVKADYITVFNQNEGEFIRKDGTVYPVLISGFVYTDNAKRKVIWKIIDDISQQKRIENQLKVAKDKAERANLVKTQFLSNMSHELRTPLNAIMGFAQILKMRMTQPELLEKLDKIIEAGQHLLKHIEAILEMAKLEAGQETLQLEVFALTDVVKKMDDSFRLSARQKGLDFKINMAKDLQVLNVKGDFNRICLVVSNLLDNAIKFTEQGQVVLNLSRQSEDSTHIQLRFVVQDTGIGMNREVKSRLFQPFEQADNSMTRKYGGAGLGLSISKHWVDIMAGEIGVESDGQQGCFAWFVVSLLKE